MTQCAPGNAFITFRRHGGRLEAAREAFPAAPLPWIDLSTGISPHPWQGPLIARRDLQRLPDPVEIIGLEVAAAEAFGCDSDNILAVPGADIGLRLLPRLIAAKCVAIASPTYSGHENAWNAAGAKVRTVNRAEFTTTDADVLVVVNPNNPDGDVFAPEMLLEIAVRQRMRDGWIIVDESFADIMPDVSAASHAADRLVVIRSFGKFYGLPGLRLGFIIATEPTIKELRTMVGDWPVSVTAAIIGRAAYSDISWQERMRLRLAKDGARLDRMLKKNGFEIVGGTTLFRLTSRADADETFLKLASAGILVRPFDYETKWLRFGIPSSGAWERVQAGLEACA